MLNEIVADKQRGVMLRFSNGDMVQLPICMDIPAAVNKLAHLASTGKLLSQKDICQFHRCCD